MHLKHLHNTNVVEAMSSRYYRAITYWSVKHKSAMSKKPAAQFKKVSEAYAYDSSIGVNDKILSLRHNQACMARQGT